MEEDKKIKLIEVRGLAVTANDTLINNFFDFDSLELLDLKKEVLTKLVKGSTPQDIGEDYYKILELYPQEGQIWD